LMKSKIIFVLATALVAISCSKEPEVALVSGVHLDALDRLTRPQDDFYQFANGGWLDSTEIPEIYSGYTVYHEVRENVDEALRTIIDDAASGDNQPGTEAQQVGDLYSTWMDTETINALGIEPMRDVLDSVAAIDSMESLTRSIAELARMGVTVPYGTYVYADLKDSTRYAAYIGQDGITMPNRDYYLQTDNENFAKAREGLPVYIAKMLVRAGMAEDAATAARRCGNSRIGRGLCAGGGYRRSTVGLCTQS
jgi:predicted metalloendopeptidase